VALLALTGAAAVNAQQPMRVDDGTMISSNTCHLHGLGHDAYALEITSAKAKAIAELDAGFARLRRPSPGDSLEYQRSRADEASVQAMPRERYESLFRSGRYQCERFTYRSDGLAVVGYRYAGAAHPSGKHPVLVFLRGGNREFGKLDEPWMRRFRAFLDSGYVVIGTQYRGNDGGEGREELGGADVRDVTNLLPLIRRDTTLDSANVYSFGASRGGMMAYLAIRNGMHVNAAVVQAGPTRLAQQEALRPGMEAEVYSQVVPGWPKSKAAFYRDRSAVYWADRLTVPLLIVHGTKDWRVDPGDALAITSQLLASGQRVELIMYEGGDHYLMDQRDDFDRRMFAWFARFRR